MRVLLAIDAGGTSTRAAALGADGACLGYGRSSGGNPTSAGVDAAVEAIGVACGLALAHVDGPLAAGSTATLALAGANSDLFRRRVAARLAAFGIDGEVRFEPDLLGMFHSGTPAREGYALVSGTGSVAARIADGALERAAGGNGWLLGDAGSGFWIGRRIVRAVVADLDATGPATALTPRVLRAAGVESTGDRLRGRPRELLDLVDALYARKPVELAGFAPLAFEAAALETGALETGADETDALEAGADETDALEAGADEVAVDIVVAASERLAALLGAVRQAALDGPIVVGGSVLGALLDAGPPLAGRLADLGGGVPLTRVEDGLLGAAVLALRREGEAVDGEGFARLATTIAERRATA